MANITIGPDGGQVPLIKTASYNKLVGLGEGAASYEFWMIFYGQSKAENTNASNFSSGESTFADSIKYLVQTTQIPPLQRENIESYGPQGVQFNQQGRFKNAQDVPISFKEVINGVAYATLREWVSEKYYMTVELHVAGESYLTAKPGLFLKMEDCWLELDGVDLSVEDASLIRPSGTLHANWCNWCQQLGQSSNPFTVTES